MNVFESVGSLVRRVALWSLCAGFACGAWAETRTWTGGGGDNLASTAANWSSGVAPKAGDAIVLDGADDAAQKAMTWDLDVKVASWTQNGYTNVVTFATVYDEAGFDCFEVEGDVTLSSGTWNHKANSGTTKTYRLNVYVGGNFTLGADAKVDVSKLGYKSYYSENGVPSPKSAVGGSHGGYGGNGNLTNPIATPYGKYYAPDLPGSGGSYGSNAGGGVFKLTCSGLAAINGQIASDATCASYYSGAGGSIWLVCGEIVGTGTLSACSSASSGYSGAGGRIAVKLQKQGADFCNFDLVRQAKAVAMTKNGSGASGFGSCGSIYGETADDAPNEGWLIFRGSGYNSTVWREWATPFTKDVTSVHVKRLTLVDYQRVLVADGQALDLDGTEVVVDLIVDTAAKFKPENYGIYMTGGAVAVNADEYAITNYQFNATCGWAPDTKNFVLRDKGRYLHGGSAVTSPASLQLLGSAYAEINADLALAGGVSIGAGTTLKLAANKTLAVGGDWSNAGTFTAAAGSVVEFTGERAVNVSGNTTFAHLNCTAPGKAFAFANGAKWKVTGTMGFEGAPDRRLALAGAEDGATWTLDTSTGAAKLKNMNVSDCNSVAPLSIAGGEGENNVNITFVNITPGEIITWTGANGSTWLNAANWSALHDGNRTPVETDNIVIPAEAPAWPMLSEDVTVASLTTAAGSTLSLKGCTLTVEGAAKLAGAVDAAGGGFDFCGDVTWTGSSVGAGANVLFVGTAAQSFAPSSAALGTVTVLTPELTVDGSFVGTTVTVGDGTAARIVSFAPGSSVACDDFLVNGDASAKNVRLQATTAGVWALKTKGSRVTGATVSDSDARESWTVEAESCADAGNNQNWRFADTRTHYAGGDWPTLDETTDLVIDSGVDATLPATATALKSLYVMGGASLKIDVPLTVAEDVRFGVEAKGTWNKPATIGGDLLIGPRTVLTHDGNKATEVNRLDLTAAGDVFLATGAQIDVIGKGFDSVDAHTRTMGNMDSSYGVAHGASHGGRGYHPRTDLPYPSCYGSVFSPTNVGCCGSTGGSSISGGGAVRVKAAGAMVIDGTVNASAKSGAAYYTGAGGSVWLEAATLGGSGDIWANGGDLTSTYAGGGGRIALVAHEEDGLMHTGSVLARGGAKSGADYASAGSVYLAEGEMETIRIRNGATKGSYVKELDGVDLPSTKYNADDIRHYKNVTVEVDTYGTFNLMQDLTIKNLVYGENAKMKLNGHVLSIRTKRPDDWPKTGLPSWVDAGGTPENPGRVEWQKSGLVIILL